MDTFYLIYVPNIHPVTNDDWAGMRFHLWLIPRKIKQNDKRLIFCLQKTYSEKSQFILCNYRVNWIPTFGKTSSYPVITISKYEAVPGRRVYQ